MTKTKAKTLALSMWRWLEQNPECGKQDYPEFYRFTGLAGNCPLCEMFLSRSCAGCPLTHCLAVKNTPYSRWCDAKTLHDKALAAHEIVALIEAW